MNRKDFQELARIRLEEAEYLLNQGHFSGAYYLCGYTIECALKACAARLTKLHDFPDKKRTLDCYTHDLDALIRASDLKIRLDAEVKRDLIFGKYWAVAKDWSEQSRYEKYSAQQARNLFEAVTDRKHGVFRWLKKNW
jgi:HEPN domain-containing protein